MNKKSSEYRRKVNFGGIELKVCMAKILNFAEIAPNLPFMEYIFYEEYRDAFEKAELRRMKRILPLHEMAKSLGLVSESDIFYQMFYGIVIDPARPLTNYKLLDDGGGLYTGPCGGFYDRPDSHPYIFN